MKNNAILVTFFLVLAACSKQSFQKQLTAQVESDSEKNTGSSNQEPEKMIATNQPLPGDVSPSNPKVDDTKTTSPTENPNTPPKTDINQNSKLPSTTARGTCDGGKLINGACYHKAPAGLSCVSFCSQSGRKGINTTGTALLSQEIAYVEGNGISRTGNWCSKIATQFQSGSCTALDGCPSSAVSIGSQNSLGCYFKPNGGVYQALFYTNTNDVNAVEGDASRICSCVE